MYVAVYQVDTSIKVSLLRYALRSGAPARVCYCQHVIWATQMTMLFNVLCRSNRPTSTGGLPGVLVVLVRGGDKGAPEKHIIHLTLLPISGIAVRVYLCTRTYNMRNSYTWYKIQDREPGTWYKNNNAI